MRDYAAAGALFVIAVVVIWAGAAGRVGVVLGAIICPQELRATGA